MALTVETAARNAKIVGILAIICTIIDLVSTILLTVLFAVARLTVAQRQMWIALIVISFFKIITSLISGIVTVRASNQRRADFAKTAVNMLVVTLILTVVTIVLEAVGMGFTFATIWRVIYIVFLFVTLIVTGKYVSQLNAENGGDVAVPMSNDLNSPKPPMVMFSAVDASAQQQQQPLYLQSYMPQQQQQQAVYLQTMPGQQFMPQYVMTAGNGSQGPVFLQTVPQGFAGMQMMPQQQQQFATMQYMPQPAIYAMPPPTFTGGNNA